jgi:hypothetical protein
VVATVALPAVANGEWLNAVASGHARSISSVLATVIFVSFDATWLQLAAQVPQEMFCVHVAGDELAPLTHDFRQNRFTVSVNGCHLDQLNNAPSRAA